MWEKWVVPQRMREFLTELSLYNQKNFTTTEATSKGKRKIKSHLKVSQIYKMKPKPQWEALICLSTTRRDHFHKSSKQVREEKQWNVHLRTIWIRESLLILAQKHEPCAPSDIHLPSVRGHTQEISSWYELHKQLWSQATWVQILVLPTYWYVTLGQLYTLSCSFHIWKIGIIISAISEN